MDIEKYASEHRLWLAWLSRVKREIMESRYDVLVAFKLWRLPLAPAAYLALLPQPAVSGLNPSSHILSRCNNLLTRIQAFFVNVATQMSIVRTSSSFLFNNSDAARTESLAAITTAFSLSSLTCLSISFSKSAESTQPTSHRPSSIPSGGTTSVSCCTFKPAAIAALFSRSGENTVLQLLLDSGSFLRASSAACANVARTCAVARGSDAVSEYSDMQTRSTRSSSAVRMSDQTRGEAKYQLHWARTAVV